MIDEFDAGVFVRLSFSICTSYFVLRGFRPHFLPRCALRTSYFTVLGPTFYRVAHFVLRTSRFSAPHSTVLRTLQFTLRGSHFVIRTSWFRSGQTSFALRAGLHFAVHIQSTTFAVLKTPMRMRKSKSSGRS